MTECPNCRTVTAMRSPRQLVSLLGSLALAAGLLVGAQPALANGCITPAAGTAGDPFLIQNVGNLNCLTNNGSYYWHRGYHFRQTADLDMATWPWTNGIGDDSDTFNGTYDGNGFAISNLTVDDSYYVGMFGVVEGATLTDITLTNVSVNGSSTVPTTSLTFAGALAGQTRQGTTITNSSVSGTLTSFGGWVGGLVGGAGVGTEISSSSAAVDVSVTWARFNVGGLVGGNDEAAGGLTVTDSFATGNVLGGGPVGGLIGRVMAPATIAGSYATGDVTGATFGATAGGGLIGEANTDDTEVVYISESFATGAVTVTNGVGGGLVGSSGDDQFTIDVGLEVTDSSASGAVTTSCSATCAAGGILGATNEPASNHAVITRAYSTSALSPGGSAPVGGGIVGDDSTTGTSVVTSSFWNPTDSGAGATSSFGTESTQGAMRSPSLYSSAGWSISDSAPSGTTWVSCAAYNSGYPFLQWYAATQGWACAPPPPPVYPPSAPRDVAGVAGDGSVVVSWSVPASSGSFAVSNYQVMASPSGRSCVVSALSCEIGGLTNGSAYEFTVRALNGAGWGPWSVASGPVVPVAPVVESIVISGVRGEVRGKPGVVVTGTSSLGSGAVVVPWVRFAGQSSFAQGSAQVAVDEAGGFTWERRTGKKITIYMATPDGSLMSNRVIVRPL